MLEVLVGKTIEQALLEVMEEEELADLRATQHEYEELRNVELAEVQRLEEQERRHREEKVGFRFLLRPPLAGQQCAQNGTGSVPEPRS